MIAQQICGARPRERRRPDRMLRHPLPADQAEHQQHDADEGGLDDLARPDVLHPPAHQERDRDRGRDREQPPRAAAQRVDDDQREHREQDDHDREDRDHRGQAGHRIHFLFRHLAERLAVAPDRGDQDREVLHGAAQDDAEDQPERPRQKAELGGERRPDQRARAGDRREVMAVGDPAVGRDGSRGRC